MKNQNSVRNTVKQIALSLLLSYLISVLFVIFYKYPVPIRGLSGPFSSAPFESLTDAIHAATTAFFSYGLMYGGFVLVPMVTLALNVVFKNNNDNSEKNWLSYLLALIAAFSWSVLLVWQNS
ncbi:hypothetical protein [Thalassotalea sediminis]|uniref:hypothetical protein n=1 Tax=Thalassotalea sediminis TaxID=1759089 RepID=UPI002573508D|nr:hypothetical protein [Thalassotalea sediminis]